MRRDVVTTHAETPLGLAAYTMFYGRFGTLLVLEGTKVVRVLTERDEARPLLAVTREHGVRHLPRGGADQSLLPGGRAAHLTSKIGHEQAITTL